MSAATAVPGIERVAGPRDHHQRTPVRTLHDAASWWLLAILVSTVLGFQRTITTRLGALDVAHAVHGAASVSWLLLLMVQAELARRHHRVAHRQLAVGGIACALIMCMSAVPMMQALLAAAAGGAFIPAFLTVMDTGLLIAFLALFAVAVTNVRRPAVHARAMAATALVALPPGLGRGAMRLLGLDPVGGSLVALAVAVLWLGALSVSDYRAGVRSTVYPTFAGGLLLLTLASLYVAPRFAVP
jgi:hypothetical protein